MDVSRRTSRNRTLVVAIMLLTFGLGCLCMPTGISSTSTPTIPPTSTMEPHIALPTATQPPVINNGKLNETGPWLLIETSQGLWAINPDGSGLTQLTTVDYWQGNFQQAVQPGDRQVVFIDPDDSTTHLMTLNILSLPGGNITKVTDLTTVKTGIYSSPAPGNPSFEALRAISERQSYAWSPDGLRLAFVGLMDGPSAELYVYDERLYKVKRVSHDDAEDFAPSWSPDGNHLLYLAADGFGTGAGMVMSGVWSAAGDGSGATRLYATQSSGEEIKGWLNNTTVLLDTWTIDCGSSHLRLYDVVTRKQTMLSNDCINSAAAGRGRGEAMYSNDNGLYLLTADNPTPVLADQEPNARIEPWGPDNYAFTVRLQSGLLATYGSDDMDHQVSPVPASADGVNVAMYGAIWGWTSQDAGNPGTWITGPGVDIGRIFDGKASFPAWDPHNNLMFFAPQDAGGYDIYLTTFDAHYTDLYKVNYIDADVNNVVWLGPR